MTKTRRITIPLLLVASSWYYEISSYQPPPTASGADTGGGVDDRVDWIAVLVRAAIATVPYLALETLWRHRQGLP